MGGFAWCFRRDGRGVFAGFKLGKKTFRKARPIDPRDGGFVPKVMYSVDEKGNIPMFDQFVDAQIYLLKSQRVLRMALQDEGWKALGRNDSDENVELILKNLEVARQGEIIFVSVTDPDPAAAQLAVKTIIAAFKSVYDEEDVQNSERRLEVLQGNETRLNADLAAIRKHILEISQQYHTEDLRSLFEAKTRDTANLQEQIRNLKLETAEMGSQQDNTPEDVAKMTDAEILARDPIAARWEEARADAAAEDEKWELLGYGAPASQRRESAAKLQIATQHRQPAIK